MKDVSSRASRATGAVLDAGEGRVAGGFAGAGRARTSIDPMRISAGFAGREAWAGRSCVGGEVCVGSARGGGRGERRAGSAARGGAAGAGAASLSERGTARVREV